VSGKARSVLLLAVVEVLTMSLWFVSAAILPELVAEGGIGPGRAAALSSAVQVGFVTGALALAIHGTSDRYDPRRVLAICAATGGLCNMGLLATPIGGTSQVLLRGLTGACLAGVYPVGMKIIVGWGTRDRGFLVGLIVGALTVGTALPHLFALMGGANWRITVAITSTLAIASAFLVMGTRLGPSHARATGFDPGAIRLAWTDRRIRLAFAGYLGHMWELYAYWAWIATALTAAFTARLGGDIAAAAARGATFIAIALGGVLCVPAGFLADRIGRARVAQLAMILSSASALCSALAFGGPVWLLTAFVIVWGATIIPDSAQFSALVADVAPPERAGSLMTFQTALGFTLTFFTVQALPALAAAFGWPVVLALLAVGPVLGVEAMRRLIKATR
jgi:MFS family permease